MDHVVPLRDALHLLGTAVDLDASAGALLVDLERAVTSTIGLEVLTLVDDVRVRLAHFRPHAQPSAVRASMRVVLATAAARLPVEVVFYAGRAGAFSDLAADLAYALGGGEDVTTGMDVPSATLTGISGLAEVSVVNQAVGVLVERGTDLGGAYALLVRQAEEIGISVADHAAQVVEQASRPR